MARKRKIAPNPEMLRLLAAKKEADARFERELRAAEAAREARWVVVGQLAEECGISGLSDAELRAEFGRIAEQKALPKAA